MSVLETTQSYKEIRVFPQNGSLYLAIPVTIKGSPARTVAIGTALGQITLSGLYDAYDDGNSDGTETASGLLGREVVTDGTNDEESFMYIRGAFKEDQLTGIDAAAKTDLKARSVPARNILLF